MTPTMERSRLAAFVDGELSPEEAASVVMHLANHPEDQTYVDDLFAANAALAAAFGAPMREPVPDRLLRVIAEPGPAKILPFRRKMPMFGGALAIAASLAGIGMLVTRPAPLELAIGTVPPGAQLSVLLDSLPSGSVHSLDASRDLMMLATLPLPNGYCREVELIDRGAGEIALGLACRSARDGWQMAVVLAEPLADVGTDDGFVAADGAMVQGLSAFLDEKGAGPSLTPDQEADLIRRGWGE